MMGYLERSWAEINLDALEYNMKQIKSRLQNSCMVMGVVKADAYGHGAKQVAQRLAQCGVAWFGVSNIEEAVALRHDGFAQPILILGTTPPELATTLGQQEITQTVYSAEYAGALQAAAAAAGVTIDCHIKLDTGMTRLGFLCDNKNVQTTVEELQQVARCQNLKLSGVFTHFASADDDTQDAQAYTLAQFAQFMDMLERLRGCGVTFALRHCANSAATMCYPQMQLDMVRPGILLYGLAPSPCCAGQLSLKPVLALKAVVAAVKQVEAGTQVSYGRTYTAPHSITVAVVPIGYADGYRRNLSGKARMLVNGCYAPVIGRVCMDQLMLDVTEIPGVKRGDGVTAIGCQGGNAVTADEMAQLLDTIAYEVTCLLSKRIPRVYLAGGTVTEVVDYIVR